MSSNDHVQVALFIDWDNLAISTAADMSGATPDIKAIVQRTQQYGTIVVARAYAEWSASSEKLFVYRSGIEPIYAPTFRFEPDTATTAGKGKSLADPCMVADFVDTLHLMPDIRTYVLVTGDKDMIPVVRLAQIRGRRVIVIGPDYVAGVLREMADEFIPYRSLVEAAPARSAPEHPRRIATNVPATDETRRRATDRRSAFSRQEKLMTPPSPLAAPPSPALVVPLPANTIRTVSDTPATPDTAAEPVAADDLRSIYAIITDLLRQRRDEGRDRIRATNLKDSLMQRMPGFSERRYGFAKFKDLLMTAQKSGLLDVIIAGPVHWISLPGVAEPSKPTPVEATSAIVVDADTTAVAPAPPGERRAEMIRFVNELRTRSRWLTYTYVLTNLISHFGRSLPQSEAENEARATLNYLVQDGVLRVDREPQEVEVGGARHRVRMCHLDMSNELVIEALGVSRSETASSPPQDGSEDSRTELGPGSEDETLADLPLEQDEEPPVMASATDTSREERARDEASDGDVGPTHPAPGHTSAEESMSLVDIDRASRAAEEGLLSSPQQAVGSRGPAPEEATGDAPTEGEAPSPLHRAYSALQQVIGEAAAGGKKVMSASSVRGRLSITLGGFNERQLGFPRFKDFLEAAENARIVHTVTRGHVTWVSPVEGGEQGDTAEGR